ncbi:MAG: hypothetical protein MSH40_04230 [Christensenella sp.]|nr:hypothetical protein [Christensenella sp.]
MQVIFFKETANETFNAGYKARVDIDYIMTKRGSKSIDVSFAYADISKVSKVFGYLFLALKLLFIHKGTALLVQYPCRQISTLLGKLARGKRIIYLIHDLEGLRRQDKEQQHRDIATLGKAYKIIAHNRAMKNYLVGNGISEDKIVTLGVFDYIADKDREPNTDYSAQLCFAGNLNKSVFLDKLPQDITVNLYGLKGDDREFGDNMRYMGSFPSDEIPFVLDGKYALVWDGDSADTCTGLMGEYTRYNNPHKLSLYICAGKPVIVWRQAAIAEFVIEQGIGVAVEGLSDLSSVIEGIDDEQYRAMQDRVMQLRSLVIQGDFFEKALGKALG